MTPRLSVLVPTRGRVDRLHAMLQSLVTTADDPGSVEAIFRCDTDDDETLTYLRNQSVEGWPTLLAPASFIVGARLNGYATLPIFINEAARLARAELLLVINDDVEFKTKGWDTKLIERAALYPDGIFNLAVDTVMNNPNVVFPCQSRRQIDLLGCFFDERLVYPDIWLRDVLTPFSRVIRVPEVVIEHQWTGRTADQERALNTIVCQPAYEHLYTRCVTEGQAKIASVLQAVAS